MNYLFVFFLIFCLSVGFVTYILSIALLIKKKSLLTLYFLIFLTLFLIIILIASLSFFLELFINIPQSLDMVFSFTAQISALSLGFILILFMYYFLQIAKNKKMYLITIVILIIVILSVFIFYLCSYFNTPFDSQVKTFSIDDILIFLLPLYPIILFIIYYKQAKNLIIARIVKMVIIVSIPFLPILLLENFNLNLKIELENFSVIRFRLLTFPLHYLLLNLIFLYYGLKYFHSIYDTQSKDFTITKEFIKKFNITEREKEVILLIYEGFSNKQIGKKLFISPATVRNHLHNIYEKTGASNRVELIRFCYQ